MAEGQFGSIEIRQLMVFANGCLLHGCVVTANMCIRLQETHLSTRWEVVMKIISLTLLAQNVKNLLSKHIVI